MDCRVLRTDDYNVNDPLMNAGGILSIIAFSIILPITLVFFCKFRAEIKLWELINLMSYIIAAFIRAVAFFFNNYVGGVGAAYFQAIDDFSTLLSWVFIYQFVFGMQILRDLLES